MIHEPKMTPAEAFDIASAIIAGWPSSGDSDIAHEILVVGLLDTGLTFAACQLAVRVCLQQDRTFRPTFAQLRAAAVPVSVPYHQPFGEIESVPASPEVRADGLAEMRRLLRGGS